jgi:signal transduction histidine kinase
VRRRKPVEWTSLVQSVVDLMRPRAERNEVQIRLAETTACIVMGDADRLRQALVNVLDNALKWTPPGGKVDLRIERTATAVTLVVADTGPGIPVEHHENVWERGVRGVDGGYGLGLPLVREVAHAHGGSAEIVPGPGTIIRIELPTTTTDHG